ncbi:hypothetical protein B4U79_17277 [Dinothrombium tinctorium]|uniref:glucan endo-1,3-beta-D-glucosidase n=1 Tax=Dinothrombium tinctorium TaxID=1965070 RepID=A0A3S4RCZ8_9ACAR|nr:hypothetical protein B4U79_17277 [Dinothrombium tinctorium]
MFPSFNSYDIIDVKRQLQTINSRFKRVSVYSMGTHVSNRHNDWMEANSNCLVAKASAELNAEAGKKKITISQGVYQQPNAELQQIEIERAFQAAQQANETFPGTVESIIFTNNYFNEDSKGIEVLDMIQDNLDRARRLKLSIGIRTNVGHHILEQNSPSFGALSCITEICDIIMCNIYPRADLARLSFNHAVEDVIDFYWRLRNGFTNINPKIQVAIGETGWASEGIMRNGTPTSLSNLKNYWRRLGDWASDNRVFLYFFEAIDEPWRGRSFSAESHFGWWIREGDNFIEKTNRFPEGGGFLM